MRAFLAYFAAFWAFLAALPVLVLAAPFLIVSTLTRGLARWLEPPYLTRDQLIAYDPEFGWKPRPNLDTHHLMVDLFHIRTDADGWRGRSTLEESDIVVFGDSFAAGYGVGERQFFANLRAEPRIKPIGIGGYSMVQELLWMQRLAPALRGKIVVWFVYFGNDLYDNLSPDLRGYRKPFVRQNRAGEWEIVRTHVCREAWPIVTKQRLEGAHHWPKLAELCRPGYLSERAYAACEYLIREGQRLLAQSGAELVVMTVPDMLQLSSHGHQQLLKMSVVRDKFDPAYPDTQLYGICRSLGVEFLSGQSFLDVSCYKVNDCHWNARGHRKVAQALAGLMPSPKPRPVPSGNRAVLSPT
jgi:hypothetical protein